MFELIRIKVLIYLSLIKQWKVSFEVLITLQSNPNNKEEQYLLNKSQDFVNEVFLMCVEQKPVDFEETVDFERVIDDVLFSPKKVR